MTEIFWGKTPTRGLAGGSSGALVQRAGETFYKISNFQAMEPFLMAVVSGFDHWMFVSSSGGLTCGRGNP